MWRTVIRRVLGWSPERRRRHVTPTIALGEKIAEVARRCAAAKSGHAALLARADSETKSLDYLDLRVADLAAKVSAALDVGAEARALEAAGHLAELESLRELRRETRARINAEAERLRLALERAQRRLADLREGLTAAHNLEAERKRKARSADNALFDDALSRLLADTEAERAAPLLEMEEDPSGTTVIDRIARAVFEAAPKLKAEDALARLKSESAGGGETP